MDDPDQLYFFTTAKCPFSENRLPGNEISIKSQRVTFLTRKRDWPKSQASAPFSTQIERRKKSQTC